MEARIQLAGFLSDHLRNGRAKEASELFPEVGMIVGIQDQEPNYWKRAELEAFLETHIMPVSDFKILNPEKVQRSLPEESLFAVLAAQKKIRVFKLLFIIGSEAPKGDVVNFRGLIEVW